MATVDVAKIKIRRGTNTDRLKVTLDSGELGFTTDTQRVFVGDGTSLGGLVVGNKNYNSGSRLTTPISNTCQVGDLVLDSSNNLLYSFTGGDATATANWLQLSPRVDTTTIDYNGTGQLYVVGTFVDTGGDGIVISGTTASIDLDSDTDTQTLLGFNGGKLAVGNLTNDSHGNLDFQAGGSGQHHSTATGSDPGFMSSTQFTKVTDAPDYTGFTGTDGNKAIQMVNSGTNTIDAARITIPSTVLNSGNTNLIARTSNASCFLSGGELTDPHNFIQNQAFPGQVIFSSFTSTFASNIGAYANYKLDFSAQPGPQEDKYIRLQAGDGTVYGFYALGSGGTTPFQTLQDDNPDVIFKSYAWVGTDSTDVGSLIDAINDATKDVPANSGAGGSDYLLRKKQFECWRVASSSLVIYVHNTEKGRIRTISSDLGDLVKPTTEGDGAVTATLSDVNGAADITMTNDNIGTSSQGLWSSEQYGFRSLIESDVEPEELSVQGEKAYHTIATFPDGKDEIANGEFFLIEGTRKRFCVYYDVDGSATAPDFLQTHTQLRNGSTVYIKVDVQTSTDTDQVADATLTALNGDEEFSNANYGEFTAEYNSGTNTMSISSNFAGHNTGLGAYDGYYPGYATNAATPGTVTTTYTSNVRAGTPDVLELVKVFNETYNTGYAADTYNNTIIMPRKGNAFPQLLFDGAAGSATGSGVDTLTFIKFN